MIHLTEKISACPITAKADAWLLESDARVGRIMVSGRPYWVKKVERPDFLRRLLKGDAQRSFSREVAAYSDLKKKNAPVARVVLKKQGYVVFADAGPTVESILRNSDLDQQERITACREAAVALADLHGKGITHGRPVLRDICWDGRKITFLDLENYNPARNTPDGHARDLACFFLNLFAQFNEERPEVTAAIEGYKGADQSGVWDHTKDWVKRNRWMSWITSPIRLRSYPHAREFKAVPQVVDVFLGSRSKSPT